MRGIFFYFSLINSLFSKKLQMLICQNSNFHIKVLDYTNFFATWYFHCIHYLVHLSVSKKLENFKSKVGIYKLISGGDSEFCFNVFHDKCSLVCFYSELIMVEVSRSLQVHCKIGCLFTKNYSLRLILE